MKKLLSTLVAAVMTVSCFTACSGKTPAVSDDKIQIVTTIFPAYDWVMNVLGDNPAGAEVTMLLDNGADLHSFQPTAEDILKITTGDMFVYVGGESDEWVDDILKEAVNKEMIVINLMDVLGDSVKEEEMVEGMQAEEHDHDHEDDEDRDHEHEDEDDHDEEDHDHEEDEDHDHEHHHDHEEGEVEYDEHVWLSLKNAAVLTAKLSESIQTLDPANKDVYKKNADSYIEKLNSLDKEYQEAVDAGAVKTLLFGDRFPFRYLVDDYGLEYYAAFIGCSSESEASFETITFLSKKVDELSLKAVLTIEGPDHKIAETIIENTSTKDQKILTMDSMQSTTAKDVEGGATYFSIMENNLTVLKEAVK